MTFQFRDVELALESRDEQFKLDRGVIPCVTCDSVGITLDGDGVPISAIVSGEPDRVWVTAYNDSIPFIVLNNGRINPQTNTPVWIGYLEDSTEREVIAVNRNGYGLNAGISAQFALTAQVSYISRSQFPILKTTAGGLLTVDVSALEYDRFGGRVVFQGQVGVSLGAFVPATGYIIRVLVYLSTITGLIGTEAGVAVQNIPGQTAVVPDTPPDGIASSSVSLIGGQTVIAKEDITEAKRITTPNIAPGLVHNGIPQSIDVLNDYTYIRGGTRIEQGQYLRIQNGGRVVIL